MKLILIIVLALMSNVIFAIEKTDQSGGIKTISIGDDLILEVQVTGKRTKEVPLAVKISSYSHFFPTNLDVKTDGNGYVKLEIPKQAEIQQISIDIDGLFKENLLLENGLKIEIDSEGKQPADFDGPDRELSNYFNRYSKERVSVEEREVQIKNETAIAFLNNLKKNYKDAFKMDSIFVGREASKYAFIINEIRKSEYYSQILSFYWSSGIEIDHKLKNEIYRFCPQVLHSSTSYFYYCLHTYIKRSIIFPKYIRDGVPKIDKDDWEQIKKYSSDSDKSIGSSEKDLIAAYTDQIMFFLMKQTSDYCDTEFEGVQSERIKMPVNLANDNQYKLYYENILHTLKNKVLKDESYRIYVTKLENLDLIAGEFSKHQKLNTISDIGVLTMKTDFDAFLYTFKGENELELLNILLDKFKGNTIIIDFWAVWCSPCLQTMPYFKTLQLNTSDIPVKFVYICTNNSTNEQAWMNKIMELKQPGIHLFVEDKLVRKLMDILQVTGYPSYLVFKRNSAQSEKLENIKELKKNHLLKFL